MGKDSNIQWTDNTVNFWHGCQKVSPGCKYCYMYRDKARWKQDGSMVVKSTPTTFNAALKWPEPTKIFTCSYSDFFIEAADQWRAEAWEIIRKTPHHTWQILTKRPERIAECLPADWGEKGYPNVWLGVSVENQETANTRIDKLLTIPAAIYFISVEPILEKIDLKLKITFPLLTKPIDWVIVGGESGHGSYSQDLTVKYGYRMCNPLWIRSIVDQCKEAKIPCFVKQLGTDIARRWKLNSRHGSDISEWPTEFQIRTFPEVKNPISDELILMYYNLGWDNGSLPDKKQKPDSYFKHPIFKVAYNHGRLDFILGDDVSSIDNQSDEKILKSIKEEFKNN